MRKISILLILASFALLSCNTSTDKTTTNTDSTSFNLTEARKFVDEDNAHFIEHFKKRDSAGLADHYHSQGQLMMSNAEPVKRENIAAAWGEFIRMGVKDFKLITHELVGSEDLMVETGSYEISGDNNALIDKGKYVVVWKKDNGNWKIYRDIANSNMPPPVK